MRTRSPAARTSNIIAFIVDEMNPPTQVQDSAEPCTTCFDVNFVGRLDDDDDDDDAAFALLTR